MDNDDSRKSADQVIIDLAKRAMASSVKSILSTEEGIRNLIGAILPKDLVKDLLNHIGGQFDEFRKDLVKMLGRELRHYGDKLDVGAEVKKVLDGLQFDVTISVSIKDKKKRTGKKKA